MSVKGGACMCYIDLSGIHASMLCLAEVLHCSASNAINMQWNNVQFLPGTATCIVSDVISYFFPEVALVGRISASFLSQLKKIICTVTFTVSNTR